MDFLDVANSLTETMGVEVQSEELAWFDADDGWNFDQDSVKEMVQEAAQEYSDDMYEAALTAEEDYEEISGEQEAESEEDEDEEEDDEDEEDGDGY